MSNKGLNSGAGGFLHRILGWKKRLSMWVLGLMPALFLSACIEGSGLQLADGIGGTGITQGRLTSFGSVVVNGVRFNTDNARFVRDGVETAGQASFNVGEIIRVVGEVNDDGKTGTAEQVIFTDVLEGPVTAIAQGRRLEVLGQIVVADQKTVFHGFSELSALQAGNIVEVSGYTNSQGEVLASSIQQISAGFEPGAVLEVEGTISQLNRAAQTFRINELLVNYTQATLENLQLADLSNGIYLIVSTTQDLNNGVLTATQLTRVDDELEPGFLYEIEGYVTHFRSAMDFSIENYPVITDGATIFSNGRAEDLTFNRFMLVAGEVNAQGVLVAEEVILLDELSEVYLEANLEAVDAENQTFQLLGQTVTVDAFTLFSDDTPGNSILQDLNDFSVGEPVFIIAYLDDQGKYVATRLSRVAPAAELYLSGKPTGLDVAQGSLNVFNNRVISDGETLYLDFDGNELTRAAFFNQAAALSYIDITGTQLSAGFVLAEIMSLGEE